MQTKMLPSLADLFCIEAASGPRCWARVNEAQVSRTGGTPLADVLHSSAWTAVELLAKVSPWHAESPQEVQVQQLRSVRQVSRRHARRRARAPM